MSYGETCVISHPSAPPPPTPVDWLSCFCLQRAPWLVHAMTVRARPAVEGKDACTPAAQCRADCRHPCSAWSWSSSRFLPGQVSTTSISEQIMDIPVPRRGGSGSGGPQNFQPRQSSAFHAVQNVDTPVPAGGGPQLQDCGASASTAFSQDELDQGVFSTFSPGKKCACRRESECEGAPARQLMDSGGLWRVHRFRVGAVLQGGQTPPPERPYQPDRVAAACGYRGRLDRREVCRRGGEGLVLAQGNACQYL